MPVLVQALIIVGVTMPFGFDLAPAGLVVGLALVATTGRERRTFLKISRTCVRMAQNHVAFAM